MVITNGGNRINDVFLFLRFGENSHPVVSGSAVVPSLTGSPTRSLLTQTSSFLF